MVVPSWDLKLGSNLVSVWPSHGGPSVGSIFVLETFQPPLHSQRKVVESSVSLVDLCSSTLFGALFAIGIGPGYAMEAFPLSFLPCKIG